jgi:ABC-type multidrug transport system ATPase subunit
MQRLAGRLSGGMKQKLGLACTLVRSPELLLLDEPSVGVDPLSRRDLWTIIEQLMAAEKLSVLVSTSYMDEAERCARVFVMYEGRLLAKGPPDALRQRARGLTFQASPPPGLPERDLQARLIDAQALIIDAVPRGGQVWYTRQPTADDAALATLLDGVASHPRPQTFEDAFMMLLREQHPRGGALVGRPALPHRPGGGAGAPMIVVRDLVRRFGDFTAVSRMSFEVTRGEIFGLLGPNGAGKTTTFRMLCGLLPASSGHLEVAGVNLGLRLLALGDIVVGLLDVGVGIGRCGELAQIGLGQELFAQIGEATNEIRVGGEFVGLRLLRHHLGRDQIIEDRLVAGRALDFARQPRFEILAREREILVGDVDAVHAGQNLRCGRSGAGGKRHDQGKAGRARAQGLSGRE